MGPTLSRAHDNCHIQITGVRASSAKLKEIPPDATAAEHQLIIKCIRDGDPSGAEKATCDHVSRALGRVEKHLGIRLEEVDVSDESVVRE